MANVECLALSAQALNEWPNISAITINGKSCAKLHVARSDLQYDSAKIAL